jgi:poly(hydroxyalkanoate) depolymerase family esterase
MSRCFRRAAPALFSLVALTLASLPSLAASWQANVNYGASTVMDLYVPDNPAESPPVVVSLHFCGGNKGNAQPWFQSYADTYGFAIVTPQAGGNCFDASPARSGERANIVAMVEYVLMEHNGDPNRVFAAGASSGACMTQALLAAYPEVFAAGSSLAGVPAGAWTGGNAYGWTTPQQSDAQWGDRVRMAAEAGFAGPWPRIQLWHGQGDTILTYAQNWPAQVAQWTNVHGVSDGASEMVQPMGAQDTWDRTSYTDASGKLVVEANSAGASVPHDLTGRGLWSDVVRFFELDKPAEPDPVGEGGSAGGGSAGAPAAGTGGTAVSNGGASGGTAGAAGMAVGMGGNGTSGNGTSGSATGGLAGAGSGGTSTPTTPNPVVTSMPATPTVTSPAGAPTSPVAPNPGAPAMPPTMGTPAPAASGTAGVPAGTTPAGTGTSGAGGAMAGLLGADDSASGDDSGCSVAAGKNPLRSRLALLGFGAIGLLLVSLRRRANC